MNSRSAVVALAVAGKSCRSMQSFHAQQMHSNCMLCVCLVALLGISSAHPPAMQHRCSAVVAPVRKNINGVVHTCAAAFVCTRLSRNTDRLMQSRASSSRPPRVFKSFCFVGALLWLSLFLPAFAHVLLGTAHPPRIFCSAHIFSINSRTTTTTTVQQQYDIIVQ